MVIEGITDNHLAEIYADPYIQKVGHDHRPAGFVDHPLVTYLTASVNGHFAGAFMAIRQTAVEFELHSLLKKPFVKHSRQLGMEFLDWCFKHPILRVSALIIEGLETAKNFCLKLGMKLEGFKPDSCIQNGQLKGLYLLGMTRGQYEFYR
jgi:hypothetical protein